MGTYYIHKATRSRKVPYSFQCEHCMKDSGERNAEISVTVEENSNYRTLEANKQEKLDKAAYKKLRKTLSEAYKSATEKQVYPEEFKDECPHCKKPQSWSIAGAKRNAISTLIAILFVGAVVCIGVYFTQGQNLKLTLIAAGVFAAVGIGYSLFKAIALMAKKHKTDSAIQKNLPTINWAPIEDLLDSTNA